MVSLAVSFSYASRASRCVWEVRVLVACSDSELSVLGRLFPISLGIGNGWTANYLVIMISFFRKAWCVWEVPYFTFWCRGFWQRTECLGSSHFDHGCDVFWQRTTGCFPRMIKRLAFLGKTAWLQIHQGVFGKLVSWSLGLGHVLTANWVFGMFISDVFASDLFWQRTTLFFVFICYLAQQCLSVKFWKTVCIFWLHNGVWVHPSNGGLVPVCLSLVSHGTTDALLLEGLNSCPSTKVAIRRMLSLGKVLTRFGTFGAWFWKRSKHPSFVGSSLLGVHIRMELLSQLTQTVFVCFDSQKLGLHSHPFGWECSPTNLVLFILSESFTLSEMKNNFWQRISWLSQRWRTQRIAISNVNCRIQWIIKSLNAHCASWYSGEHACLRINKSLTPESVWSNLQSQRWIWVFCVLTDTITLNTMSAALSWRGMALSAWTVFTNLDFTLPSFISDVWGYMLFDPTITSLQRHFDEASNTWSQIR